MRSSLILAGTICPDVSVQKLAIIVVVDRNDNLNDRLYLHPGLSAGDGRKIMRLVNK